MLGLYAAACLKERGASEIVVTDIDPQRLGMAREFSADRALDVNGMSEGEVVSSLGERYFHGAIEVCGDPAVIRAGVAALRLKGRYVIVGLVCAGADFTLDGNTITRNYLTLTGIHNYAPEHLAEALKFLERTQSRFPYEGLVGKVFPLGRVGEAFARAAEKRDIRVGVIFHSGGSRP